MLKEITGLFITISAFWHVLAFAYGIVFIHLSLKSIFRQIEYDNRWSKIIRTADLHLWLSGIAIILLGIYDKGLALYISNPKLWCKVTVVVIWLVSSKLMHKYGIPELIKGNAKPMINFCSVNLSCWIYGAILGCAKPLAYGVVTYPNFISGFLILNLIVFLILNYFRNLKSKASS